MPIKCQVHGEIAVSLPVDTIDKITIAGESMYGMRQVKASNRGLVEQTRPCLNRQVLSGNRVGQPLKAKDVISLRVVGRGDYPCQTSPASTVGSHRLNQSIIQCTAIRHIKP